jgi:hypothetical protein
MNLSVWERALARDFLQPDTSGSCPQNHHYGKRGKVLGK